MLESDPFSLDIDLHGERCAILCDLSVLCVEDLLELSWTQAPAMQSILSDDADDDALHEDVIFMHEHR